VEALTDGNDLRPATRLVRAGHKRSGAPAIDAQGAVCGREGPGQPETCRRNPGEDLSLPRQFFQAGICGLEDHITGPPGHALPTAQQNWA
jgi:hypothetical protein